MEPETANGVRRPAGLWLLTVALLTSPAFHLLALVLDTRWLNFGSHHPWDAFVYFVIAPVVGDVDAAPPRAARFSVYVFLSCEILRAIRIHSGLLGLLAAGSILYLQLPAARRFHPAVDPRKVMARLRLGLPHPEGAVPSEIAEILRDFGGRQRLELPTSALRTRAANVGNHLTRQHL